MSKNIRYILEEPRKSNSLWKNWVSIFLPAFLWIIGLAIILISMSICTQDDKTSLKVIHIGIGTFIASLVVFVLSLLIYAADQK